MSNATFFTAALGAALDQGMATAEDVLAFATPDVLSTHLPRPLWARLLMSALGAPRLAPSEVVDIVGISNLCEHVPPQILWACLAHIAQRSLGGASARTIPPIVRVAVPPPPLVSTPPPPAPVAPAIMPATPVPVRSSAADLEVDSALDSLELGEDADPPPARAPVTAGQTSRALAGASSRRPQRRSVQIDAQAADPETALRPSSRDLEVLDEQLVEWSANEETKGGQDVP